MRLSERIYRAIDSFDQRTHKILSRTKAAWKSFTWDQGDWVDSNLPGNRFTTATGRSSWIPGSGIDWERVKGDPWECPAVQATLNWLWRNLPQAIPQMYKIEKDGTRTVIADHPFLKLIRRPHSQYDWTRLVQGISLSLLTNNKGSAYISIEPLKSGQLISSDGANTGTLTYRPHPNVREISTQEDPETIIRYEYHTGANRYLITVEEMVHIRFGVDPRDVRGGLGPLASANRDVYALQQDSNYRANILRNFGTVGAFVWPKNESAAFDPSEFTALYRQKTQGDNVGDVFAIDIPLEVEFPEVTPQSMSIETMADRPESNVSAQTGVPAQVAGLHVGRLSKTYANAQQAKESAWEEGAMPLLQMIAAQMWHKLGPLVSPTTYEQEEFGFDFSGIRALQPDLDALYRRANDAWKLNAISLFEWKTMVGLKPSPADKTTYYRDVAGGPQLPDAIPSNVQGDVPVKSAQNGSRAIIDQIERTDWAERVAAELEVLHGASA